MITKEKKVEKVCSFYASDYHLEMIMIPYINRKIEEKANVVIITERSLTKTAKDVVSKINISQTKKEQILNINWGNNKVEIINKNKKGKELSVFVIGSVDYIENMNEKIENLKDNRIIKIINCYKLEDVQEKMTDIVSNHTKVLNTTEEKEIA
ncbi:MAG: hypothetical protein IKF17_00425 [Clostridia bacterium]|nr:hypothetical protein [Clostridia bacterium]